MRLFIAIQFNKEITDSLVQLQEDMKTQGVQGNYTKPENLHLTTSCIGEYGNPDEVMNALEQVTFDPFPIKLDGVGQFGDIFWAGTADSEELKILVKRIRRALSQQEIPFDKKKFSPHITLIRRAWYRHGEKIPVYRTPDTEMTVTSVSLMKSERGRHGMIYTEIGAIDCRE